MFTDATIQEVSEAMQRSWQAFQQYKKCTLKQRAAFMRTIAEGLENSGDALITTAMRETNLTEARLRNERARTAFQLRSYGEACEQGQWLEVRIDTAVSDRNPPKPDLRKTMIPLGPVVVFGSSNFPFAYSTAGGDTACAFAAGCTVVVKAHPAHAETSEMVSTIILKAARNSGLPEDIFIHLHGASFEVGEALVKHPHTRAVGFTGSLAGGRQLFDWGNQREQPIPVFAEMGSINPVYLLDKKLEASASEIAKLYAASITLGAGQFCTNPGLIIGIKGKPLNDFVDALGEEIKKTAPAKMLHAGIAKAYSEKRAKVLEQSGIQLIAEADADSAQFSCHATIVLTTGNNYLANPLLHQEVFGPYSLVVECADTSEMKKIAGTMEGQLTSTLMATAEDLEQNEDLADMIRESCGRIILNGVPTGVEVCLSMHHGGPYPATTDSRFTSVGADGIKRFARPVTYQNFENRFLPDELKNENPLHIFRTINNELTKDRVIH